MNVKKETFPLEELSRKTKKIIGIAKAHVHTMSNHVYSDVELCRRYNSFAKRKAVIMPKDNDYLFEGVDKISHAKLPSLIGAGCVIVNHMASEPLGVIESVRKRYKNGLCVVQEGVISEGEMIREIFCDENTGIDWLIYFGDSPLVINADCFGATDLQIQFLDIIADKNLFKSLFNQFGEELGTAIYIGIAQVDVLNKEIQEYLSTATDVNPSKRAKLQGVSVGVNIEKCLVSGIFPDDMQDFINKLREDTGLNETEILKYYGK